MYIYSQKKIFQRNTAKRKLQHKDFLRVRDKISQLHFEGTRECYQVEILGEKG